MGLLFTFTFYEYVLLSVSVTKTYQLMLCREMIVLLRTIFSPKGATAPSGPGHHYQGFTITHGRTPLTSDQPNGENST
jgi:hypothetical protein